MWSEGIFIFEMTSLKTKEFFTCAFGDVKDSLKMLAKILDIL